jgi:hypothetical protein
VDSLDIEYPRQTATVSIVGADTVPVRAKAVVEDPFTAQNVRRLRDKVTYI